MFEYIFFLFLQLYLGLNNLGVNEIIRDDFSHLGEMPSVPFLQSHDVVVDFLVEFI